MSVLASRYKLALLVPVVWLGCGSSSQTEIPDYNALRGEDITKHSAYPTPPPATASAGWTNLAPEPGPALNSGVAPPQPVVDAAPDVTVLPEAGPPDAAPEASTVTPDHALTTNVYISGSSQRSPTLFAPDTSATITRTGTGTFMLRTTSSNYLSFSWTSTDMNVIGFAVEFGSESYIYYPYSGATGYTSGNYYLYLTLSSTVCSQLPNQCYSTNMKLYAITRPADSGAAGAGASIPATIPVAVDCGGCF
jgi:hypothetical protein